MAHETSDDTPKQEIVPHSEHKLLTSSCEVLGRDGKQLMPAMPVLI